MINDFESFWDGNYGMCFRFNSGFNMKGENTPRKSVYDPGKWVNEFQNHSNNNTYIYLYIV